MSLADNDLCFNISEPDKNGTYEDYKGYTNAIAFTNPITDGAEVDLLSGIVKINTSPITYDTVTPLSISTFNGVNNIYADVGDTEVTYRKSVDKAIAELQALILS